MPKLKTDDEVLLKRVAKVARELLDASVDEQRFNNALERMFKAPTMEPAKRKRGKRGITKSRGRQK